MNHITDVALYEAMSEGQQKQAEMWVLGCQPNSVLRKAIHPLPYQPHSTHITHVCLCDRKLLRDLEEILERDADRTCQLCECPRSFPRIPWARHGLERSQQLSEGPHSLSCPSFLPPLRLSVFTEPRGFASAVSSALNTLPQEPHVAGFRRPPFPWRPSSAL